MKDYTDKITACFFGKSIGGTLGMPYEGVERFMEMKYYDPVPTEPVPNDDLDLQLVWLDRIKEKGLELDNKFLAEVWRKHIDTFPDEYGIALWNIKKGLKPPLTGIHNNEFTNGMGAAIRSEIWASLFPGKPLTAAWYAYQDASVDHWGEGIYAEIFLAASQSHLYDSENIRESLEYGLSLLPESLRLKTAVQDVMKWHDAGLDYVVVRDEVMNHYGNINFTDCIMNVCIIIIGLLYGDDDFEKSLLYAINCGQDADCTGATIASFMGIALGSKGIPEHWKEPIGETVAISDYITGIKAPKDLKTLVNDINEQRARFENKKLPEIKAPFCLPDVDDFSDKTPWMVDGEKMCFEGFKLDCGKYKHIVGRNILFETNVKFKESGDIQIMVCSGGLFDFRLNGKFLGSKGDYSVPVPAPHRVKGGRVFNACVEKDEVYKMEIELKPTLPVPDIYVAFTDMEYRHLLVEYLEN